MIYQPTEFGYHDKYFNTSGVPISGWRKHLLQVINESKGIPASLLDPDDPETYFALRGLWREGFVYCRNAKFYPTNRGYENAVALGLIPF